MGTRILHGSDGTPFGRMARIILAELDLPFERDLRRPKERTIEEMAQLNPVLRIPVLVEPDGRVFYETRLILEYLLETYPVPSNGASPALLPTPVRAEHRWEDALLTATLQNLLEGTVTLRQMDLSGVKADQAAFLQRHQLRIRTALDWLETQAHPDGLLPGWFSVPDVMLVCTLDFGAHMDVFQWRGRPRLEALMGRLSQRPSVAATIPKD